MRTKLLEFWRQWVKPLLITVAIMGPLRSVVADWNDVPSGSMLPTILVGDRIWINKLAYDLKVPFSTIRVSTWSDPQRGDIIVFRSPADGKRLVKRVVGVPGDLVELRNDRLHLNGQAADYAEADAVAGESALVFEETSAGRKHPVMICPGQPALRSFGPVSVPAGHYFVMGDNRDNSFDSRFFGCVPRSSIVGRATAVAMSFDREHCWRPRPGRFMEALQ